VKQKVPDEEKKKTTRKIIGDERIKKKEN